MFKFLKPDPVNKDIEPIVKESWFDRLHQGLKRTRHQLADGLADLMLGKKTIDNDLLSELETILLTSDVGIEVSQRILDELTTQVRRNELTNPEVLITTLKEQLKKILRHCQQPLLLTAKPSVILTVGVNGVGKTTTIAKLAHYYQQQQKKIMLAAGDTFRAAAIEQLQAWGTKNRTPVIAQQQGADSASVIYDAVQAAIARNMDILIADTAGRLHTQDHLMAELQKIKRIMTKLIPEAPHETLLVIDAGTGQNALNQARQFHESIGLSGIVLTKLDGTAKGGIIFAICEKMKLPIRFIGVGEKADDLKPFDADEFVEALFKI